MVEDVVRALGFVALGSRMKRIGERLQADTQRIFDRFGVPVHPSQYPFLLAVDRLGPLTIGELAEAIGITQPGATRALAQLVELGLLEAEQCSDDQRRRIVSLSRNGKALVDAGRLELWPRVEGAVRDLCGDLSGPLLDQLAAIEDGLDEASLEQRANDPDHVNLRVRKTRR